MSSSKKRSAALNEPLIHGPEIDGDLRIGQRTRRLMIKDGRLPPPDGYIAGKAVWKLRTYLRARARLLAEGRRRRLPQESSKEIAPE